jgi:agmatinase
MPDRAGYLPEGTPISWPTFLDTPPAEADFSAVQVAVIPVAYDRTTSYMGGARLGPEAIIRASRHLEDYDLELERDISLIGIHTTPVLAPDVDPRAMVDQVRRVVHSVARQGKMPALLGGEHTIAVGAVQAMAGLHSGLSVLYLDAHADLRESYMGTQWGHASVARRLSELCPLVQVGVRSLSSEERDFIRETRLPAYFWSPEPPDISQVAESVLERLSDPVYLSIDLDVFDPSLMAAVGTPEPGGMSWSQVTGLLRAVAERRKIVGFDITELSPGEGPEACSFTAAKLAYKLIGYATST